MEKCTFCQSSLSHGACGHCQVCCDLQRERISEERLKELSLEFAGTDQMFGVGTHMPCMGELRRSNAVPVESVS